MPFNDPIKFNHQETEKLIKVLLINDAEDQAKTPVDTKEKEDGDEEEEKEDKKLVFQVKLERPSPAGVAVAEKNICFVEIVPDDAEIDKDQEAEYKYLNYLLEQKNATWGQQFKNAVCLGPALDAEGDDLDEVTGGECIFHFLSMGWKLLFSLVPPRTYCNGWAAFIVSLTMIGLVTLVVGEFANLLGCAMFIKQPVTAITFVALGTSLPDTFASMTAARGSKYADSAVGNITGSNSVNVFLGLGLPWVIATIYNRAKRDTHYKVPAGTLGFSVALFLCTSVVCFILLALRRKFIGGELGGPTTIKYVSSFILVCCWFFYIIMSTLQNYDVIKGF